LKYNEKSKRQPEMFVVEGRNVKKTLKFATTFATSRCTVVSESAETEEDVLLS
jgi:hypothetical protein